MYLVSSDFCSFPMLRLSITTIWKEHIDTSEIIPLFIQESMNFYYASELFIHSHAGNSTNFLPLLHIMWGSHCWYRWVMKSETVKVWRPLIVLEKEREYLDCAWVHLEQHFRLHFNSNDIKIRFPMYQKVLLKWRKQVVLFLKKICFILQ